MRRRRTAGVRGGGTLRSRHVRQLLQRLGFVAGVQQIVALLVVQLGVRNIRRELRVRTLCAVARREQWSGRRRQQRNQGTSARRTFLNSLNMNERDRGMMPRSLYRSAPPVIVNVLPDPVCPYANSVELKPSIALRIGATGQHRVG